MADHPSNILVGNTDKPKVWLLADRHRRTGWQLGLLTRPLPWLVAWYRRLDPLPRLVAWYSGPDSLPWPVAW